MRLCLSLIVGLCLLFKAHGQNQNYFPIPAVKDPAQFVKNISYTASLLTSSTPQNQQEVRILIYGQSISAQVWWQEVKSFLEKQYPHARLNMINKAIGGFSSERLKLTVDNDVTSFYPDLIFFHDYGGEPDYELIIKTIRSRTTAEIIIQTDHIAIGQGEEWHGRHNDVWLPELCRKYNLAYADVRTAWKEYLKNNNLQAKELLTDAVHLNAHGNYLMAGILNKYLAAIPAIPAQVTPTYKPVQILKAGTDFKAGKKKLTLPVTGNRVDLVFNANSGKTASVAVKADDKKPSEYLASYYYTRPSALAPEKFFLDRIGQLIKLNLGGQQQEEDWTLTITSVDSIAQQVQFSLRGSRTGEDGTGTSATNFVSKSGRIQINSDMWFRRRSKGDYGQFHWIKVGDTLKWQTKLMGQDEVKTDKAAVTVLQGVENKSHQLQLKGKGVSKLTEIRVYAPPVK